MARFGVKETWRPSLSGDQHGASEDRDKAISSGRRLE
jgi:hypothetical protein